MIEVYQNRPTRAVVSFSHLKHNLDVVKSYLKSGVKVMGTVKANAYGHGLLEVSQALIQEGVDYLGVAYVEEAVYLRKQGIKTPILVLGAINTEQIPLFLEYDIDITTSSMDKSKAISMAAIKMGKMARVHLKVDTGMERIGVHWYSADRFISETFAMPGLDVVGLFSHLARADDETCSKAQIQRFDTIVQKLKAEGRCPPLVHMLNSSGIVNYPEAQYDMVRAGIVLYGYTPEIQDQLRPVMSLVTKVSYFKVVPKEVGVGYNHTYVTSQQTRVVTLPVGYGDGYLRAFSNKGAVFLRGKIYPVVGNVCMDQLMVDIGPEGEAYCGDDVEVFGAHIKLDQLCQKIGTIPYEVLCCISQRVPRVYFS